MGLLQIVKSGVVEGNKLEKVFEYCKKNNFAMPSVKVINTESINVALESASNSNSAIIIQLNYENAKLFSGKIQKGDSSLLGANLVSNHLHTLSSYYKIPVILSTDYVSNNELHWIDDLIERSIEYYKEKNIALFSSLAIDISKDSFIDGIKIAKKYLKRVSKVGMALDIKMAFNYNDDECYLMYEELQKISKNFTLSFRYLDEEMDEKKDILAQLQKKIQKKFKTNSKPLNLVVDGDYCTKKEIREIINTGVVKVNLDNEIKDAFRDAIDNFTQTNQENKILGTYIEPTKYLREIQKITIKKLNSSIKEYNAKNTI